MRIRTIRVWHGATEKWPLSEGHRPHFRGVRVALGTGYSRPGNEDGARVSSARHAPTRVQSLSVAVCVCVGGGGGGGAWGRRVLAALQPRRPEQRAQPGRL
jgi:hypothetical protein